MCVREGDRLSGLSQTIGGILPPPAVQRTTHLDTYKEKLFEVITPVLMGGSRVNKLLDLFGEVLQLLVDLLDSFVGDISVELFLAGGGSP